jgi:hypothetical protein
MAIASRSVIGCALLKLVGIKNLPIWILLNGPIAGARSGIGVLQLARQGATTSPVSIAKARFQANIIYDISIVTQIMATWLLATANVVKEPHPAAGPSFEHRFGASAWV